MLQCLLIIHIHRQGTQCRAAIINQATSNGSNSTKNSRLQHCIVRNNFGYVHHISWVRGTRRKDIRVNLSIKELKLFSRCHNTHNQCFSTAIFQVNHLPPWLLTCQSFISWAVSWYKPKLLVSHSQSQRVFLGRLLRSVHFRLHPHRLMNAITIILTFNMSKPPQFYHSSWSCTTKNITGTQKLLKLVFKFTPEHTFIKTLARIAYCTQSTDLLPINQHKNSHTELLMPLCCTQIPHCVD